MKYIYILIFLNLFIFSNIYGQQDTLVYKYRRMSVDYQHQIKMAEHNLQGAKSMVDAAKADYLPKIAVEGNLSLFGPTLDIAMPNDAENIKLNNLYFLNLGINQSIYSGGYLKNTKNVAESKVELMKYMISISEQTVLLNSDGLYWQVVAMAETEKLALEYKTSIDRFLTIIQNKLDEGEIGMSQLFQAKVRYNDAENSYIKVKKNAQIYLMQLNQFIGIDVYSKTTISDSIIVVNWSGITTSSTGQAFKSRPEIGMLKNKVTMNEFGEKVVASKYNPKIGFGVNGTVFDLGYNFKNPTTYFYNVGIKLKIPIYYGGMKKKETFASRQITETSRLEVEETKDKVNLQVQTSYFNLQETQKQLDFSIGSLNNAHDNVSTLLIQYNEGLASVLEVLDAQLYWQKTYFNYIQAKYELNMAYSSYQYAMGELNITK